MKLGRTAGREERGVDGSELPAEMLTTGEKRLCTVVGRGRAPSLGIRDLSSSESRGGDGGVTGDTLADLPASPVKIGEKLVGFNPPLPAAIIGEKADFSPCWFCENRWACWSRAG